MFVPFALSPSKGNVVRQAHYERASSTLHLAFRSVFSTMPFNVLSLSRK